MNRIKRVVIILLAFAGLILGRIGLGFMDKEEETAQEFEPTPVIISTHEEATNGYITGYDNTGRMIFQYYGKIETINDGCDGHVKEIEIHMPYTVE